MVCALDKKWARSPFILTLSCDIVFNNRKSKSRRFNRGGILLDEDSSKDARGFPVWDDDEE